MQNIKVISAAALSAAILLGSSFLPSSVMNCSANAECGPVICWDSDGDGQPDYCARECDNPDVQGI